jgi:hypothetical protein
MGFGWLIVREVLFGKSTYSLALFNGIEVYSTAEKKREQSFRRENIRKQSITRNPSPATHNQSLINN